MVFRDDRMAIPFEPRTGLRLVAHGRLDVFEAKGTYQLYVDSLQPSGFGDLAIRFEELKAKLAAEGLFDPSRRRPLPPQPEIIGIATSLSGAVLHDIRKVLARRWPLARVVVAACQVQGDGAPQSIVSALRRLGRWTDAHHRSRHGRRDPGSRRRLDGGPLGVQRGDRRSRGGRAPVSDRRRCRARDGRDARPNSPPTCVPRHRQWPPSSSCRHGPTVRRSSARCAAPWTVGSRRSSATARSTVRRRTTCAGRVSAVVVPGRRAGAHRPAARPSDAGGPGADRDRRGTPRADERSAATAAAGSPGAGAHRSRPADGALDALSPFATLERGYAIVRAPDGSIIRNATDTSAGQPLDIRLNQGSLDVRVERVRDSAA